MSSVAMPPINTSATSGTTIAFASTAYGASVENVAAVSGHVPICVAHVSASASRRRCGRRIAFSRCTIVTTCGAVCFFSPGVTGALATGCAAFGGDGAGVWAIAATQHTTKLVIVAIRLGMVTDILITKSLSKPYQTPFGAN